MMNLKESCPELLQQLPGFPVDGNGTALESIIKEAEYRQKDLRTALGFAEGETTVEDTFDTNMNDIFTHTKEFILSMLDDENEKYLRENPKKLFSNISQSGKKISKILAARTSTKEWIQKFAERIFEETQQNEGQLEAILTKELPKYPYKGILNLFHQPMIFVQNFFSEVSAIADKSIGFTTDMLMMIRGCNSKVYSSCYTIKRTYNSMAPITLALSGTAGMIYVRNNEQILGRCWVVFDLEKKIFSIMKPYGFLSESQIFVVASWLCAMLNNEVEWDRGIFDEDSDDDTLYLETMFSNTGVYGDPIRYVYSHDKTENLTNVCSTIHNLHGRCIFCGKRTQSSLIYCNECSKTFISLCSVCGNLMFKDTTHEVQICPTCLEQYEICPKCGQLKRKEKQCVCETYNPKCTFCGSENAHNINGVELCDSCAEAMLKDTCYVCGTKGLMYPFKGEPVCLNCFARCISDPSNFRLIKSDQREKLNELLAK